MEGRACRGLRLQLPPASPAEMQRSGPLHYPTCNFTCCCRDATGHIEPHGGKLVNLMVSNAEEKRSLEASCTHRVECSDRNACDVELLSVGGFSPLTGFMNKAVYDHVLKEMRCVALACASAACCSCSRACLQW